VEAACCDFAPFFESFLGTVSSSPVDAVIFSVSLEESSPVDVESSPASKVREVLADRGLEG
jgi:hypothetical protein